MFTGIIEKTIQVLKTEHKAQSLVLTCECPFTDVILGESIALNGACLTVASFDLQKNPREMVFFLSAETLHLTDLAGVQPGDTLNAERALLVSQRLSGHIVQGHVDGLGSILSLTQNTPESHLLEVLVPSHLKKYCVKKGSICLSGISLTINEISESFSPLKKRIPPDFFCISIQVIPHTWYHTHLHSLSEQSPINIEVDILSKYLENLQKHKD